LYFDGKSGYIDVPSTPSNESISSTFSFTVWYKLPKTNFPVNWLTILCKGTQQAETASNPQYRLQVMQDRSVSINVCNQSVPAEFSTISINTEFTECDPTVTKHFFDQNVWHFYAVTYDGQQLSVYMDATKIYQGFYTGIFNKNSDHLLIGKDIPGVTEYFNGALDDLRIFGIPLSEPEVYKIFKEKSTPFKPEDNFDVTFPEDITVPTDFGSCKATVKFPKPLIKNNCYPINISQVDGPSSGSSFANASTKIRFKLNSASGTSIYSTFHIKVIDQEDPNLKLQSDTIIILPTGDTTILFNIQKPIATDNCAIKSITQLSGKPSGSIFEVGEHIISYQAQDEAGNLAFKSFSLKIVPSLNKIDTIITKIPEKKGIDTSNTILPVTDTLLVSKYKKLNLVLLVDISNSMSDGNKLNYLKKSLKSLILQMRLTDYLSVVLFSNLSKELRPLSPLSDKEKLISYIDSLIPQGGTNFESGINAAINVLKTNYEKNALNHLMIFTDGEFTISKPLNRTLRSVSIDDISPIKMSIVNIVNNTPVSQLQKMADDDKGYFLKVSSIKDAELVTIDHIKSLAELEKK